MKKDFSVSIALLTFALILFGALSADAQWRSKTHDVYEALTDVKITIDGDVADWAGVLEAVTGTDGKPFTAVKFSNNAGKDVAFEEFDGGKWTGSSDHETSIMMVWEPATFYIGLIVTDDEHENNRNDGWNGDAFQVAFEMTGKRQVGGALLLYNLALGGNGKLVIQNEQPGGPGLVDKDVAIVRNEGAKKTYYETQFSAKELGAKGGKFAAGMELGVGICVNDGDKGAGQDGQKGWSGWYAASIVFGKEAENTGLVRLTDKQLAVTPKDKLTTTWGALKSQK
jgi:hypothetical protein